MPFGDTDWLALTREPVLEPEVPICDPHHHFFGISAPTGYPTSAISCMNWLTT